MYPSKGSADVEETALKRSKHPMYAQKSSVDVGNRLQIWQNDPMHPENSSIDGEETVHRCQGNPMYPSKSSVNVGTRPQIWQNDPHVSIKKLSQCV